MSSKILGLGLIVFGILSFFLIAIMIFLRGRQKVENKLEKINLSPKDANDESAKGILCISLHNTKDPEQSWQFSLSHKIVIGRDVDCQICLDESSVSRHHCKLYLRNALPMVENLSESNITLVNGVRLSEARVLALGDQIKCGRVSLEVAALYYSDSSNIGNLNKMTMYLNV